MRAILEYITMNYTWFLGAAIIILLAIIGSYADKTNFGQGKQKETKEEIPTPEKEINSKMIERTNDKNVEQSKIIEVKQEQLVPDEIEVPKEEDKIVAVKVEQPIKNKKENFEETFAKFDQEFDALVPKKDIIDEELLDEIDNLSLDKTQKLKLTDIPDLDDVDLPKIKSLNPVDEDIWKF